MYAQVSNEPFLDGYDTDTEEFNRWAQSHLRLWLSSLLHVRRSHGRGKWQKKNTKMVAITGMLSCVLIAESSPGTPGYSTSQESTPTLSCK